MTPPPATARVAGAAALIAVLTVASRLTGFGRTAVFAWSVGPTRLGDLYVAANTVPNIVFEIVAGGALASLVVPLLAGAVAAGDRRTVSGTVSALLTWTLTLLVPLAVVVAVAAEPIVVLLAGDLPDADLAAGTRMLRVFAPQLPLYGIAVVLTGVLQAHHRFAWPVIAPLLSSVMVIGTYLAFAVTQGRLADLPRVDPPGQFLLAVGTTGGVSVLSLSLLFPLRRLRLRLRPGYDFPGALRQAVGGLAAAGVLTVGAQQIAVLVSLKLALAGGVPAGTVVLFTVAQTVYLLPWAVLAVPLATAAYPTLAAARATGDVAAFRATLAPAARGVLLLSCLGAAALVAVAVPAAVLLVPAGEVGAAAAGIAGFAPGLIGYGLFAVLSRALYAWGRPRPAALAVAAGWLSVVAGAVVLAAGLADQHRVLALALANSLGMTVLGGLLVRAVVGHAGRPALAGLGRAALVGLLAGLLAGVAGTGVGWLCAAGTGTPTALLTIVQGMLSGVVVAAVFLGVAYPLDRHDVRPAVLTVWRRTRALAVRRGGKETVSR